MDNRIREAFDAVQAGEALKSRTRARLLARLERIRRPARRRLAPVLACCLILAAALGGAGLFFTPTSAVSIDVNPSLELEVNCFDRVVAVTAYGGEAQALADTLSLRFRPCAQAVEEVLTALEAGPWLEEGDGLLSIAVVGGSESQSGRLLSAVEDCAAGRENVLCRSASAQAGEEAHHLGLSCGKYLAYLDLLEVDPDVTPQQVQEMTMAEIRSRIAALSGGEAGSGQQGQDAGQGQGTGQGYGQGGSQAGGQGTGQHHGWDHGHGH